MMYVDSSMCQAETPDGCQNKATNETEGAVY